MPGRQPCVLGMSARGATGNDQRFVLLSPLLTCLIQNLGSPYCLRRDSTALRNMRDYTGVSASRLEILEERRKSDVITELADFQGRVLLHNETPDGQVVPVWESVDKQDVTSIREIMDDVRFASKEVRLTFVRIPVTSESSPDVRFSSGPSADPTVPRSD